MELTHSEFSCTYCSSHLFLPKCQIAGKYHTKTCKRRKGHPVERPYLGYTHPCPHPDPPGVVFAFLGAPHLATVWILASSSARRRWRVVLSSLRVLRRPVGAVMICFVKGGEAATEIFKGPFGLQDFNGSFGARLSCAWVGLLNLLPLRELNWPLTLNLNFMFKGSSRNSKLCK